MDVRDATSHADTNTTCPDGQRTSTDSVNPGSTVTGTNTGADVFTTGRCRGEDFAGAIAGDAACDGEMLPVNELTDASRARSSRFQ